MRILLLCSFVLVLVLPQAAWAAQPADQFMTSASREFGYPHYSIEQYQGKNAGMLRSVVARFRQAGYAGDYRFYVMTSPEWNAFASAGMAKPDVVCVLAGLLDDVTLEDELAGIVAHEISHNRHSDASDRLLQGLASGVIAHIILDEDSAHKSGADQMLFMQFMMLGYSRKMETRSDAEALFMITELGYDPRTQVALWTRIAEKYRGFGAPKILLDHPPSKSRARDLQRLIDRHMVQHPDGRWEILSRPSFKSNDSSMRKRLERGAVTGLYSGGVGLLVEAATYEKGKNVLQNSLQWAAAGFVVGVLFDTDFPPTMQQKGQLGRYPYQLDLTGVPSPYNGTLEPALVVQTRW